jgi:hypothetical protein
MPLSSAAEPPALRASPPLSRAPLTASRRFASPLGLRPGHVDIHVLDLEILQPILDPPAGS